MDEIYIKRTSNKTADVTDICLYELDNVCTTFQPMLVINETNPDLPLKGKLIYNKGKKDADKLSPKKLRKSEWMEISLDTEATYKLYSGLKDLYELHSKNGLPFVKSEFVKIDNVNTREKVDEALEFLNSVNLSEESSWSEKYELLNSTIDIMKIKKSIEIFEENLIEDSEQKWQDIIEENIWLLSQIFSTPTILHESKAYVGGKGVNNKGGNIADFLLKNKCTDNIVIIEIKTPVTKLIKSNYRNTYLLGDELYGGINQVLNYKDSLVKEYYQLNSKGEAPFRVCNPKCILIIGNTSDLDDEIKKDAFENFRSSITNVEIITYSEIINKAKMLLEIFNA